MIDLPPLTTSPPRKDNLIDDFLFIISTKDPWYGDILLYLRTQKFATHLNREERRCIQHQAICHLLIGDVLYRRGIDTILWHCLTHDEAETILNDCHSGTCGGHLSGLATTYKILCACYFWPSIFNHCIEAIKHCRSCQLFSPKARTSPTPLHPVVTIGPFCKWAIDFMTINPTSANGHKYIIVAVDYFTKWAESMPTFDCKSEKEAQFFLNHVISRFGVPKKLVSDHGTHFQDVVWDELSTMLKF